MILFKDALVFTPKDFDEKNFKSDSINTVIQLKDVNKCDFDLDNNGKCFLLCFSALNEIIIKGSLNIFLEFQLIYNKNNNNTCYSINLKVSSIEEKHTWKKLLTQRLQQTQK